MTSDSRTYRTIDFRLRSNVRISGDMNILTLEAGGALPEIHPGQFVNVSAPTHEVLLRRPISICDTNAEEGRLVLLVKNLGRGSAAICRAPKGSVLNILLPLGNGFTLPEHNERVLLVGGGVGMAPLYYLARTLQERGNNPTVLLGARSLSDIVLQDDFRRFGKLFITTEDGSTDTVRGFVTDHELLRTINPDKFSRIYCCGPFPMMKAVAKIAASAGVWCEVSLENKMACGVGACLCCVEETTTGNRCTCTDGPVFNIDTLTW